MKFSFTKHLCLLLVLCLSLALFGCSLTKNTNETDESAQSATESSLDSSLDSTTNEDAIENSNGGNSSDETSNDNNTSSGVMESGKYMLCAIESYGEVWDYQTIVMIGLGGTYLQINADNTFSLSYPEDSGGTFNGTYDTANNTMEVGGDVQPYTVNGDYIIIGTEGNGMIFTKGDLPETEDSNMGGAEIPELDANATYYAEITIRDYGKITVELSQKDAPITVANFVDLARNGFYDGLTFHRIIEGFMMQGGDPLGNGKGGSGRDIVGEFSANGYNNTISHNRGVISMARADDYNSASSQFFIMQGNSDSLDGQYAAFGWVTEGMDVVDAICSAVQATSSDGTIPSYKQPVIESIVIIEK